MFEKHKRGKWTIIKQLVFCFKFQHAGKIRDNPIWQLLSSKCHLQLLAECVSTDGGSLGDIEVSLQPVSCPWILKWPRQAPFLIDCYVSKEILFKFCFPGHWGVNWWPLTAMILKHRVCSKFRQGRWGKRFGKRSFRLRKNLEVCFCF